MSFAPLLTWTYPQVGWSVSAYLVSSISDTSDRIPTNDANDGVFKDKLDPRIRLRQYSRWFAAEVAQERQPRAAALRHLRSLLYRPSVDQDTCSLPCCIAATRSIRRNDDHQRGLTQRRGGVGKSLALRGATEIGRVFFIVLGVICGREAAMLESIRIIDVLLGDVSLIKHRLGFPPGRIRPPCSTMPWEIVPALLVLWGVCWMFFDNPGWPWEDQEGYSTSNTIRGIREVDNLDPNPDFNTSFSDLDFLGLGQQQLEPQAASHSIMPNFATFPEYTSPAIDRTASVDPVGANPRNHQALSIFSALDNGDLPVLEQQPLSQGTGDFFNANLATIPSYMPDSSAPSQEGLLAMATTSAFNVYPISTTAHAAERSSARDANSPLVSRRPRTNMAGHAQNTKHSQTEKYLCPYPNCPRSKSGSGFKRREHLNQHLCGPHKHTSIPRVRATPNSVATNNNSAVLPSRSQQQQQEGNSGTGDTSDPLARIKEELEQEKKLRQEAEQETRLLRQKLETERASYETRLRGSEERFDKMMALLGERREKGGT